MAETQLMQAAESRASRTIREGFESGRPVTYVRSIEEQRVERVLHEVGRVMGGSGAPIPVWSWTVTEGLRLGDSPAEPGTADPRHALDFVIQHRKPGIFQFKDLHDALIGSAEVRRRMRDVYQRCLDQHKFVVVTSAVKLLVEDLERSLLYVELRPPDQVELRAFVAEELERIAPTARLDEETIHSLARTLQGLTLDEARYALRRAVGSHKALGPESLPALLEEKRLLINRSGTIEFIPTETGIGEVGGLDNLKKWLLERRKLFEMRDQLSEEIVPKGILLMGIPGCGKSLCVKATASHFGLPLYRVDMVEIFSGRHGKPEGAFVQACRMMEDMAPAVLWFDEIERGVTATVSGGEQGRIFGFFLTWMQEKTRGLFVAATANRINELPAEMIRKGRFDEVFFVDLPTEDERIEIFRIHLQGRGVDPGQFRLDQLKQFTVGWAGSEIEQCVVSALTRAKLEDRDITEEDLIMTAVSIVPLSRTMKEQISYIRDWAFERAVRASPKEGR